jgi:hypothetical protein
MKNNYKQMNKAAICIIGFILLSSCVFETSQDPYRASEQLVSNYLNSNYEVIYDNSSVEMKLSVTKKVFTNICKTQEKLHGKPEKIKLQSESTGKFKTSVTRIYNYIVTNENNETYDISATFLRGHLVKIDTYVSEWKKESDFIRNLVNPIKELVKDNDSEKIYNLLGKKYPLEQIKPMIHKINSTCSGVSNRYNSCWIDNDKEDKMMVVFVYAYEGKGLLDYRFHINNNGYTFAGIFFTPDPNIKLPELQH